MKGIIEKLKKQQEIKYIGLLIVIMVIHTIRYFPFKLGGWNQIQLSLNYSYGFVQRAFLGTVLDLCSRILHIPWGYIRFLYAIITMLVFSLLLIIIIYKTLQSNAFDETRKSFFFGLALLFFMGPGWNTYYSNFAHTDIWLSMLSILGAYIIFREKNVWITLMVSVICVLIHPAYVFMYFNFILASFAYKIFIQDKSFSKKYGACGIIVFVFTSMIFLYMMFFSHAKDGITIEYVMDKTARFVGKSVEQIANHKPTIAGYLFREGSVTGIQFVIQDYWLLFLVMSVMFSPFILEVYRYWHNVFIYAKKLSTKNRWVYIMLPLGIITVIPMYIMHNDYGRWTYAVFFYEFGIIWLINMLKDSNAEYATKNLMKRVAENKIYYIVLLFYAGILGAFEQNLISPLISTVETYAWKVLSILGL